MPFMYFVALQGTKPSVWMGILAHAIAPAARASIRYERTRRLATSASSSLRVLAGPYAMLLADYGADVIKIEQPGGADDPRRGRLGGRATREGARSAYYLTANRSKRSLTLV
jgi:hypothetical protein